MSLSMCALQRHGLLVGLLLVALVCLREPVGAADPGRRSSRVSSLQQKIKELDRAGKYREAIPIAEEHLKLIDGIGAPTRQRPRPAVTS